MFSLHRSPRYISLKDQIPEEPLTPITTKDSELIDLNEALKLTPNDIKDNQEKRVSKVSQVLQKPKEKLG